jgi:dihydrolipoamide dehydrogenase
MKTRRADVVVIGAGTAGLNAVRELQRAETDWVLVESAEYGTTCARVGCMPSKLLIAAAERAHHVATAREFGIDVQSFLIDANAVFGRVRCLRDQFVAGVVRQIAALPSSRRLRGTARFTGPLSIEVDGDTVIEARSIVIATGNSPVSPPPFDKIPELLLSSDDVFELKQVPQSLAVVGTGAVGLELGQSLARLGADVCFFSDQEKIGPLNDVKMQHVVRNTMCESHRFHLGARISSVHRVEEGTRIAWEDSQGRQSFATFDQVLVAAGRRPNIADLNLGASGLDLGDDGLPDWNQQTTQCGDSPIFIAGDANGHRPFLHDAADEGRIAGQNAASYPEVIAHVRRTPLSIVFSQPQMATVGCSIDELDENDIEFGEISFADQGRAKVIGENTGLVRLYADKIRCRLLGAELFGPQTEHLAHLLAWSVQQQLTVQTLLGMPFYHPVLEEGLRTGLRDLAEKLQIAADSRCEDFASAPGT